MEHDVLMKTFNSALLMGKQDQRGPGLPVIGDVLQQLTFMQKTTYDSISSEKRLMFNEVDRLQTFNSWPHMNYKQVDMKILINLICYYDYLLS